MDTVLFLIFAYIGGTIGIKIKLPAGAILGSMLFVGTLTMTNTVELENVSPVLRVASKVALGTMIGLMFTKKILSLPFERLLSFILLGLGSIFTSVFIALIFKWFGQFSFITGLIAVAPGGIAEMLTLSESINNNTQVVVMMHLIRFVTIMLLLRWMITFSGKQRELC